MSTSQHGTIKPRPGENVNELAREIRAVADELEMVAMADG